VQGAVIFHPVIARSYPTGLVELNERHLLAGLSPAPEGFYVSLRGGPPFLNGQDQGRLDFDRRHGDEKCPQVWLWAQVWESSGVTGRGLRL
jgi:hypothetical protein